MHTAPAPSATSRDYLPPVPIAALRLGATPGESLMYAILWEAAGQQPGTVHTSATDLAADLCCQPRTARKWLQQLLSLGLVEEKTSPSARLSAARILWVVAAAEAERARRRPIDPLQPELPFMADLDPPADSAARCAHKGPARCAHKGPRLANLEETDQGADYQGAARCAHKGPRATHKERDKEIKKERNNSQTEEKGQQPTREQLLASAADIYARMDRSTYRWLAISAALALDRKHISAERLDELLAQCKGADNIGQILKAELAANWLTLAALKIELGQLGIPWKRTWFYAENPREREAQRPAWPR